MMNSLGLLSHPTALPWSKDEMAFKHSLYSIGMSKVESLKGESELLVVKGALSGLSDGGQGVQAGYEKRFW